MTDTRFAELLQHFGGPVVQAVMQVRCGWCRKIMRAGTTPETTTICPSCMKKAQADPDWDGDL